MRQLHVQFTAAVALDNNVYGVFSMGNLLLKIGLVEISKCVGYGRRDGTVVGDTYSTLGTAMYRFTEFRCLSS